jgi:hypothetical protein
LEIIIKASTSVLKNKTIKSIMIRIFIADTIIYKLKNKNEFKFIDIFLLKMVFETPYCRPPSNNYGHNNITPMYCLSLINPLKKKLKYFNEQKKIIRIIMENTENIFEVLELDCEIMTIDDKCKSICKRIESLKIKANLV